MSNAGIPEFSKYLKNADSQAELRETYGPQLMLLESVGAPHPKVQNCNLGTAREEMQCAEIVQHLNSD